MTYKYALTQKGYGPDILPHIDNDMLVLCGLTYGDAIHLKQGASIWWNSPEVKCPKVIKDVV